MFQQTSLQQKRPIFGHYMNFFCYLFFPFSSIAMHGTASLNQFCDDNEIKFFMYEFHFFDGLKGLDLLTKWAAKIKDRTYDS